MVLVCLTLSAMLAEGSAIDWSVIYMRDIFATLPLVNGTALALTAFFQFITRYFADEFVVQYGPRSGANLSVDHACRRHSCGSCTCLAVGSCWICVSRAGSSVIFPLAMSAAAQLKDRPAAVNVAALAQISFVVFLIAPPLLGLVAEYIGIRYAFAICLPFAVLSLFSLHSLSPAPF